MAAPSNRYSLWKYLLIIFVIALAFVYAAPNLYGDYASVQIIGDHGAPIDASIRQKVENVLKQYHLIYKDILSQGKTLLIRFNEEDNQLRAKELLQQNLGEKYLVALNLSSAAPAWFKSIGAIPMKLGLDLRGGLHFLYQVDVDSVIKQRIEGDLRGLGQALREQRIRYAGITRRSDQSVEIVFKSEATQNEAYGFIVRRYNEFNWQKIQNGEQYILKGDLLPQALFQAKQDTIEQAMNTLRNRVNELGVSEAIVQQQGENRIAVDLPGIQDSAEAKNIIGKTATLEFHLVDNEHNAATARAEGNIPPDTKLYNYSYEDRQNQRHEMPLLLKNQIVLRGSSIIAASSGTDEYGKPAVHIRLAGAGDPVFTKVTAENVGKPMAVVYVEIKATTKMENGKPLISYQTEREVISAPVINQALGRDFQITGLVSHEEARTLALLLRAGALPAPVSVIEERQIGPTLGKQNIQMGLLSVEVGMGLVVVFMALYYGVMGLIADLALAMNLVLIVALLSLLGATLTLPGIAGIVLTVGMAVDANVLIFERIREELRRGMGVQASIYAGYERAFVTILDANLTTLIVMMILFSLGSGVIKGIAITVTIGLITSMFTAITGTRALVNLLYGNKAIKHISIGI